MHGLLRKKKAPEVRSNPQEPGIQKGDAHLLERSAAPRIIKRTGGVGYPLALGVSLPTNELDFLQGQSYNESGRMSRKTRAPGEPGALIK